MINDVILNSGRIKQQTNIDYLSVVTLLQTSEAAILVPMEFTWMISQSLSLKWQRFISLRGLYHHNLNAVIVLDTLRPF